MTVRVVVELKHLPLIPGYTEVERMGDYWVILFEVNPSSNLVLTTPKDLDMDARDEVEPGPVIAINNGLPIFIL